ncbi:carbohydrate ABC transporter membrane protein 2, CUT1 family [Primorskyibacter flagellatus]|uniref:Carbohydrate ABC transporter membrane protein 2, CUT1 family n=2 Tax=Primorskyibacter flagellatus TaxID=1387277 RepID=A0A1W2EDV2_9RHOB|nr:carbohydrate ABC transporter membrane protein 2, CUT1 family [Primorskyibacter flagellatus]
MTSLSSGVAPMPTKAQIRRQRNRKTMSVLRIVGILLITALWLLPVLWICATAFKSPGDVISLDIFFTPTLDNFAKAVGPNYQLGGRIWNSIIVTVGTLLVAIPSSTAAAYAFSRFRYPGGIVWPIGLLATQFVPAVMIIIPLFILFRSIGLLDTPIALIAVNLSVVVPYAIWMIKGFMDALPMDMEEAAMMDGASRFRALIDVVIPVAMPGIITATIFCFVVTWNEFFYALILTSNDSVTLPVSLMSARTDKGDEWEIMAVIGLTIMVPMMLISRVVQRHFLKGLTAGAVK